jgi:hypothetical protein
VINIPVSIKLPFKNVVSRLRHLMAFSRHSLGVGAQLPATVPSGRGSILDRQQCASNLQLLCAHALGNVATGMGVPQGMERMGEIKGLHQPPPRLGQIPGPGRMVPPSTVLNTSVTGSMLPRPKRRRWSRCFTLCARSRVTVSAGRERFRRPRLVLGAFMRRPALVSSTLRSTLR